MSHFGKHDFTELAALEFTDNQKGNGCQEVTILHILNVSKAFDTLDHSALLSKYKYYGIRDTAFKWLKSYLPKPTQYVDCNGISSSIRVIEAGVPQWPILGQLLFMIYMDDLNTVSDSLNVILYVDDTTFSSPMSSFSSGCYGDIKQRVLMHGHQGWNVRHGLCHIYMRYVLELSNSNSN